MTRKSRWSFMSYRTTEHASTALLMAIADRMSRGDYGGVSRLFGADLMPTSEDNEPVTKDDLPRFGDGERPPATDWMPKAPKRRS